MLGQVEYQGQTLFSGLPLRFGIILIPSAFADLYDLSICDEAYSTTNLLDRITVCYSINLGDQVTAHEDEVTFAARYDFQITLYRLIYKDNPSSTLGFLQTKIGRVRDRPLSLRDIVIFNHSIYSDNCQWRH